MHDFQSALEYISDLEFFGIKFGLKNISAVLEVLGNPQYGFRSIHVAGTNGKGSVSAMLSAILNEAGYKVGLFTSPHLVSIRERIRLGERIISEEDFQSLASRVKLSVPAAVPITFFEFMTAMAFLFFAEKKIDIAVVETGMGGRLDATNVLHPELAVITNASWDHQAHLGNSLLSIAKEKAGIIKSGFSVVTGVWQPKLLKVIRDACLSCKTPLYVSGQDFRIRKTLKGKFAYQGIWKKLSGLEVSLRGEHQLNNAALALSAVELMGAKKWSIPEDSVRSGLKKVVWPGRQQLVEGNPPILLDGAHNIAGVKTLSSSLSKDYAYRRLILIWGGMSDKDHHAMLKYIAPLSEQIIFTKPKGRRAADPDSLATNLSDYAGQKYAVPELSDAVRKARAAAGENDLICIAGSLYLIGEAQTILGIPFSPLQWSG